MRKLLLCLGVILLSPGASFGQALKAKLILCSAASRDFVKARAFYGALLGSNAWARTLSDVEAYHQPISSDGIDLNLTQRQGTESFLCFFSVADLSAATAALTASGGSVVSGPLDLPISEKALPDYTAEVHATDPAVQVTPTVGRFTLFRDPDGNLVGLVQLEPHTLRHFKEGKYRVPLSAAQVAEHARAMKVAKAHFAP